MKLLSFWVFRLLNIHSFFELSFYNQFLDYEHQLKSKADCLKHYIYIGKYEGVPPNKRFDPIAFKLCHPVLATWPVFDFLFWRVIFNKTKYDVKQYASVIKFTDSHMRLNMTSGKSKKLSFQEVKDKIYACYNVEESVSENVKKKYFPPSFYIEMIKSGKPFCYVKRTHGVWDKYASLQEDLENFSFSYFSNLLNVKQQQRMLCNIFQVLPNPSTYQRNWGVNNIMEEWQESFNIADDNYFDSYSDVAASFQTTNKVKKATFKKCLDSIYTENTVLHDALVWKDAVYTGEINLLIDALRSKYVVVVGPKYIANFHSTNKLKGQFIEILPTRGAIHRNSVIKELSGIIKQQRELVILYQAGMLSHIFIKKLYDLHPDVTQIDLGLTLSIWSFESRITQPWYNFYKEDLDHLYPLSESQFSLMNNPDKLKEKAVSLESKNLALALKYMERALELRPNGKWIRRKIVDYKNKLKKAS